MVFRACAAIWKERGLLTAKSSPIQHKGEISQLLEAVNEPQEIVVIHCKRNRKGVSNVIKGNNLADEAVKTAAKPVTLSK